MRVYIEDRAGIAGGKVPAFYDGLAAGLPRTQALGARLLGAFCTAGATGAWNEVFVYWEMDSWAHYAAVMNELGGPGSLCDAADPGWELRTGGSSLTMSPTEHSPSLADLLQSGVTGGVFLHEYIRVIPGQRDAYVQHYIDNYLEATRRAGRELVGIWSLQRSANDVLILLAIRDWESHAHGLAERPDAYAERPWRTSAPKVREDYDLRMLVPGPREVNPLAR